MGGRIMKSSFSEIISLAREGATLALLEKARIASRLAKISAPSARAAFYNIKHELVQRAIEISPCDAYISEARLLEGDRLEIGLYMRKAGGIHTHVTRHELGAFKCLSACNNVRSLFESFGTYNKAA
jgi:hypothetical protein